MKKIFIPTSFNQIKETINYVDAYLIGVKGMSVNLPNYYTIDELKEINAYLKQNNKELFVSVNKNIHNHELNNLKNILTKLNELDIKAVFYYDLAIPNLKDKLNLKYDLVWAQEHLTNNYYTCNYWHNHGVKYTHLSSEITMHEILEIKENTNMKLIVSIFGFSPIFTSKRNLVKNYLKTFNISDNSNLNYIEKEGNIYPVNDEVQGTTVYSSKILNATIEIPNLEKYNFDYILINSFNIKNDIMLEVLKKINIINDSNKEQISKEIDTLLDDKIDTGFMYKETIYKVK